MGSIGETVATKFSREWQMKTNCREKRIGQKELAENPSVVIYSVGPFQSETSRPGVGLNCLSPLRVWRMPFGTFCTDGENWIVKRKEIAAKT